jgi:hypothetical protein
MANKTSKIRQEDGVFVVDMYLDDQLLESRKLPGKNIYYAEDTAENWETGIIKLEENT